MYLKKEWSDVEQTTKELEDAFRLWRMSNLICERGKGSLEDMYGFPYTSTSDYAAIWNCQGYAEYRWCPNWRFEALAVNERNEAVAVFEHEDGTEDSLDRMYIVIGKAGA